MKIVFFVLAAVLFFMPVPPAFCQQTLVMVLKDTLEGHKGYNEFKMASYHNFVKTFKLEDCSSNRNTFLELSFLHDLLTGKSSTNYLRGGILEAPYFWHWVNPNPRHSIVWKNTGELLNTVRPPAGFGKYKSRADIDRTPFLYLSEIFSETPLYYHKACGDFYSFGWCSEREMAFNALVQLFGYRAKIKQEGIHTFSEVWVELLIEEDRTVNVVFKVDNTFDEFEYSLLRQSITIDEWAKKIGSGTTIHYYNSKAHSLEELEKVKQISVGESARKRIIEGMKLWVEEKKRPFWKF